MPERYGIDVFGTDGALQARLGDISGQPWGGSGYTLPEGTFGLWGKRDGVWIKGITQVFYAVSEDTGARTISLNTLTDQAPQVTLTAAFPFGAVNAPQGRMVTLEVFFYKGTISAASFVRSLVLTKVELLASLNGAAESVHDNLYGPSTVGTNTWSAVKARLTCGSTILEGQSRSWTSYRLLYAIRMFSHEVNAATTKSETVAALGEAVQGREGEGTGAASIGTGSDLGGYGGAAGGGGNKVF